MPSNALLRERGRFGRRVRLLVALPFIAAGLQSCAVPNPNADTHTGPYQAEIRRTALGIPHVKAGDWGSLGYGYGYVQAQDNLCTMADGFVTWRGERSRYFGADARPTAEATFEQPANLDADFFFRFIADDAAIARYRQSQTAEMRALIDGFVAGYNRYVGELARGDFPGAHAACRTSPWAGKISNADVYRRLYAANLAGGAVRFVTAIATAKPPAGAAAGPTPAAARRPERGDTHAGAEADLAFAAPLAHLGGHSGIGSNALAFGADATHSDSALLLANPHWFWNGPDRFYQAQLTIPGKLNVSGVSFLGVPLIVMGFNDNVAWAHTVSTAKRFGLFRLTLVPGSPTRYQVDGKTEAMTPTQVKVDVRAPDGSLHSVSRTLYRSRFGPLVNLGALSPALAWNGQQAFALRDINADNFRVFENFLEWNQASSLDDFIRIQKKNAALPWVNTLAIGRGDPRVWYADIGAVPDVPDELAQRCTPPVGKALAQTMPGVPFLDGSRSDCDWRTQPGAAQPRALPVAQMPSLLRRDYVGNFNGSYWLSNPAEPLTGYAQIIGATQTPQSLRTRLGHSIATQLQRDPQGVSADALGRAALDSRSMSALLFKRPVLDRVCGSGAVAQPHADAQADADSADKTADLREACKVLASWDDTASASAVGATLWDELWRRLLTIPPAQLYAVQFDPAQPLTTPLGIAADPAKLAAALRDAIAALHQAGIALAAPRSAALYIDRDAERIPLFGGCDAGGYFTAACAAHPFDARGYSMDVNPSGDTYLQIVSFAGDGDVLARTLLASSESDDAASPHYADATRDYAARRWLSVPFSEASIARDPALSVRTLSSSDAQAR
ncbi:penicillin acylase family protein [Paraburkholderia ginsengisoli]|uniref:Penicillin acylase family protein n=1 Tax=Paraburkholderia ginsengisoli TaxID=311231 RepID=A0A7T4TAC9_9BURK|nr:penicillin acylase family protein [Paraburkholderia ginsengisoli]QQC65644.1 penicillin acylase family protein [Paraburkholderia ginsengisoli]